MRVIAGRFRSRVLDAPGGLATRPTSDRLRETLFNVLTPRIEGARFLDLYAGSGAVGIEALSRGAAEVVFVERAAPALAKLRANLEKLGIRGGTQVRPGTVAAFLKAPAGRPSPPKTSLDGAPGQDTARGLFGVVFLDPPYEAVEEYQATLGVLGGVDLSPRSRNRDLGHPSPGGSCSPISPEAGALGQPPISPRSMNRGLRVLAEGGVVVAEHRRKDRLEERYGELVRTRVLEQGDAALSFYER